MNSAFSKTILHIDDDEDDRELVEEAIKKLDPGMAVLQADSGEKGIAFLKQAKNFNDLPCLIILDLNMPGKDGKEVLNEIKKDNVLASLPIIIFTTSASMLDKTFASKHNVELLVKPRSYSEFPDVVRLLLERCPPT